MKYSYTFNSTREVHMMFIGKSYKFPTSIFINRTNIVYGEFGKGEVLTHKNINCGVKMGCTVVEIDFLAGGFVVRTNRRITAVLVDEKKIDNPPTDADSEEAAMAAREDWNAVVDKEDWTMVVA